jgi:hypothetical protein
MGTIRQGHPGQWGGSGAAGAGAWAGEEGLGEGVANGGQSGMKIHTDDHLAVILLQVTSVTGEALLAEISTAMNPVTNAGRRRREMINIGALRGRRPLASSRAVGVTLRQEPLGCSVRSRRVKTPMDDRVANHLWSRLGSNQRPSACEADALPLSHGTGAETANDVED